MQIPCFCFLSRQSFFAIRGAFFVDGADNSKKRRTLGGSLAAGAREEILPGNNLRLFEHMNENMR